MRISQRLVWMIYAGVVGAVATIVSQKAVRGAWRVATGDEPPDPNDPATPLNEALIWSLAGGIGIGISQMMINRFTAARWEKAMGTPAPSKSTVNVRL